MRKMLPVLLFLSVTNICGAVEGKPAAPSYLTEIKAPPHYLSDEEFHAQSFKLYTKPYPAHQVLALMTKLVQGCQKLGIEIEDYGIEDYPRIKGTAVVKVKTKGDFGIAEYTSLYDYPTGGEADRASEKISADMAQAGLSVAATVAEERKDLHIPVLYYRFRRVLKQTEFYSIKNVSISSAENNELLGNLSRANMPIIERKPYNNIVAAAFAGKGLMRWSRSEAKSETEIAQKCAESMGRIAERGDAVLYHRITWSQEPIYLSPSAQARPGGIYYCAIGYLSGER